MKNTYSVVIDEADSYIHRDPEGTFTYEEACGEIVEYADEAGYSIQRGFWAGVREMGESAFIDAYLAGRLTFDPQFTQADLVGF